MTRKTPAELAQEILPLTVVGGADGPLAKQQHHEAYYKIKAEYGMDTLLAVHEIVLAAVQDYGDRAQREFEAT